MDNLLNLAKQGYSAYQSSQGGQGEGQGEGQGQSHGGHGGGQGGYGGQGGGQGGYGGQGGGQGGYGGQGGGQGGYGSQGGGQGGYGGQGGGQGGYGGQGGGQGGYGSQGGGQGGYGSQGGGQGGYGGQGGGNPSYGKTGGEEYNSPYHSQQGSGYGGPDIDHDEAARAAQSHGSGDHSMYQSALSHVQQNRDQHEHPINEGAVQDAHRQVYEEGSGRGLPASALGGAAALQALKKFTSGGGGGGGGGSQTQLISMAMGEASKLFDQHGDSSSGGKQDAVNGAAMTVTKLLVQSKFSSMTGGGNSGGLGGLASMASKFM